MHDSYPDYHMNIAIDIGNSRTKLGIIDGNEVPETLILESPDQKTINNILNKYPIERVIISSVKNSPKAYRSLFPSSIPVYDMGELSALPFINLYETPKTLGHDRKALASGALSLFSGHNVLVISAGTAITYDFIDRNKQYHGGAISPGMNLRFKSLNTFTGNLPLAQCENLNQLIGKTTEECIASGVIKGIEGEMIHQINLYEEKFSLMKIILTGGDSKYFDKTLKNNIFACLNLVLVGLNEILEFNV